MPTDPEACGGCRFWLDVLAVTAVLNPAEAETVAEGRAKGVCRRYPQAVEKSPEEWCGEFKRKPLPTC
jgi:hypothetical protein